MILSKCQQAAETAYYNFLTNDKQKEMVIAGFAGSGKSFLTKHLIDITDKYNAVQSAIIPGFRPVPISITATTNKAANVASWFSGKPACTIHSLLGLKVRDNYEKGITEIKESDRTGQLYGIVFIDEASMIDFNLYQIIRKYTKKAKVVYIGDNYQLPPVFSNESVVFTNPNTVFLKEIQRQVANNPIIQLSQKFRAILDQGLPFEWPDIVPDNKHIFCITGSQFEHLVRTKFTQPHGLDDMRIIGWTNNKVISYNKFVRTLYTNSIGYDVNEQVIVNSPVMLDEYVAAPIDTVLTICSVQDDISKHNIKGQYLKFVGIPGQYFQAYNHLDVDNLLKHYRKAKDWHNFFDVKNFYIDVRPPWALTCHKAQGSTFEEVFIDLNDIDRNNKWYEIARLVYVALTRASNKVYLYGSLKSAQRFTNNGKIPYKK